MSGKITVIDRQQARNIVAIMVACECRQLHCKPEFLVAKDEILAALATVSVTLSSLLTMYLTKFYRLTIMWC